MTMFCMEFDSTVFGHIVAHCEIYDNFKNKLRLENDMTKVVTYFWYVRLFSWESLTTDWNVVQFRCLNTEWF